MREVAKQFEALFMQELMKSMRATTLSSGMLDNEGSKLGTEMLDQQFATQMTGLPGGLSEAITRQLERQMGLAPGPIPAPAASNAAAAARRGRRASRRPGAAGFVQQHSQAAQAAEARHRHPGRLHDRRRRRTKRGWGRKEIRHADGTPSFNLFGIKAGRRLEGRGGRGHHHRSTSTARRSKMVAKFRAYASYAESFADYARLMKDSPRYQPGGGAGPATPAGFAAGPAARRLCHRPGLCRQADAGHQHHAAPAARFGLSDYEMSASALMSLGMQAMAASYAALQTTGHNIANANVDGYSRQQVELATAQGQFSGAGFFGKGVDVSTVTRAHNAFLTREAATAALAGGDGRGAAGQLQRWNRSSPPASSGLGYAAGQFLNAMVDLPAGPATRPRARWCWRAPATWPTALRAAGAQLDELQRSVQRRR